jgi:hypothetical protein
MTKEKVHLNNSFKGLPQPIQDDCVVILAEEITMYPMSTHEISGFIINKDDEIILLRK